MNIIEKNNLVDEAYNQLLQMIASGEWWRGASFRRKASSAKPGGEPEHGKGCTQQVKRPGLIESRQGFGYSVRNLNIGIYLNSMLPTMLLHSRDWRASRNSGSEWRAKRRRWRLNGPRRRT